MPIPLTSSAVVLTTGSRPAELSSALRSLEQSGVTDRLVIWNSSSPAPQSPCDYQIISAGSNLGIPGGRNFGGDNCTGDIIVFLDDDAEIITHDLWARVSEVFFKHPECAVVAFRIVDENSQTVRRHNPRLGNYAVDKPGTVATFLGGACAIRRTAFEQCGGYDSSFFYSMEEQDLAWRLFAAGYFVHYAPEIIVQHPRTSPSRHEGALKRTWENRSSAAGKSLPFPLMVLYLLTHGVRGAIHGLPPGWAIRTALQRIRELNERRQPMRWKTVFKLASVGRPPIF